jgi:hypothetical protein
MSHKQNSTLGIVNLLESLLLSDAVKTSNPAVRNTASLSHSNSHCLPMEITFVFSVPCAFDASLREMVQGAG